MKAYTNVSRKNVGEDRVAICPNFGCEYMTRVKPLKFRFLGFGKHPKCKKHRIPLVYVDKRIGDFMDAALACFFDKAGLPPSELLEDVKSKFPDEFNSFVEGWMYCITVGRGAPIVSRYMDTISNAYLKQLTKKQIKALKKGYDSKPNLVNKAIKDGMDEITIQYTRILKHLRAHSEILVDHQKLQSFSRSLQNYLKDWQEIILKRNEIVNSPENKREMTLKETKFNYDQILNIGTCRSLLGLNPESKEVKKAGLTAFDRFSVYHEFYSEGLTSKFTKSDISNIISESKLNNHHQPDIDKAQCGLNNNNISFFEKFKDQNIFLQNLQELNGFCLEMDDFNNNSEKRILTISVEVKEKIFNEVGREIEKIKKGLKPKSLAKIWRDSFQDVISQKHLLNIVKERFFEIYEKIWGSKALKKPSTYRKTDRLHIEDVEKIITEKRGKLINTFRKEKDTEFYLRILCKNKHIFEIAKSELKRGRWCPKESKSCPKTDEEHRKGIRDIISAKNGTIIDSYKKQGDGDYYFKIQCDKNHIFIKRKTALVRGRWCPYCNEGKYEKIILWYFSKILSHIIGKKICFKKVMLCSVLDCSNIKKKIPERYKDLTISNMHFDGFFKLEIGNQIFNIVIEYQGSQHYEFPNRFNDNTNKGRSDFLKAQLGDNFKRWLDFEKNIILIEFPYNIDKSMSHPKRIRDFIVSRLRQKLNISIGRIPEFNHITQGIF
ncbi:MAG: hypothetical protein CEE42_09610 [Promethearchaeota archaeon Loki_b31]|nr:MAG: hypothetical protein CEE42_09610 [Candidatus Lokiarchaeota archaeon Loki_b31]